MRDFAIGQARIIDENIECAVLCANVCSKLFDLALGAEIEGVDRTIHPFLSQRCRDFLQAGFRGVQHVAYWTEAFDADLARATAAGFEVCMGGEVGENGRFVYFEDRAPAGNAYPGTVIELSEVAGPKGKLFDMIRAAAVDWDGKDPVRPFPDLSKL